MILLAAQFDAPLSRNTPGPASAALQRAADTLLHEIPDAPTRIEVVYTSPGLAVGWLNRGRREGGKPLAFVQPGAEYTRIVVLDGYLTAGPSELGPRSDHAATLARMSLDDGSLNLDGSFVATMIDLPNAPDALAQSAHVRLRTDPAGSRPIYAAYRQGEDGRLLVGPAPKCFLHDPELRGAVLPASILSMAVNSYLFDELTYWRNTRLLGPARQLDVQGGRCRLSRYWAPVFGRQNAQAVTLDEYEAVLIDSLAGHLRHFQRPAIGLSGGVDSRLMLAAARKTGREVGLVTWSYERDPKLDGDLNAAGALADALGIPTGPINGSARTTHLRWPLDAEKLAEQFERVVFINDGLIGHLGAYADREPLAVEIARHFDVLLIGDQCYRGEEPVNRAEDAVTAIGITPARRVRFPLLRDFAREALPDYEACIERMIQGAEPERHTHPQDLHDRLYWQVRVPRLLTGPRALFRLYMDACSPLLSKRMIELSARLKIEDRVGKALLRQATHAIAPEVMVVPYAATHSRIRWRKLLKREGPMQRRLVELLLDTDSGLFDYVDRAAIEATAYACILAARSQARPNGGPGGGLLAGLMRMGKAWAVRRSGPTQFFLNLVTLNQWFRQFN